ncbi:hypothetical protein CN918_29420 [Priestia megaterium]|nr:hypothetical protein CN918_29420 [Priestia megaterium]
MTGTAVKELTWTREKGVYKATDVGMDCGKPLITMFTVERHNSVQIWSQNGKTRRKNHNGWLIIIRNNIYDDVGKKICDTLEEAKQYCLDYI